LLESRRRGLVVTAVAVVGLGGAAACAPQDPAQEVCDSFQSGVYSGIDPTNQSSFFTTSSAEAAQLTRQGYSYKERLGASFRATATASEGLVEVRRLYRQKNRDYLFSAEPGEIAAQIGDQGYVDQGTAFYVSPQPSSCLVPVHRYAFRGQHRLVVENEDAPLTKAGWKDEGVKFYAAPSTFSEVPGASPSASGESSSFTIAVVPDTQLEVIRADDTRLRNRSVWLVENQKRLNLAFMIHMGDIVEDDSPNHEQFVRARQGLAPLQAAGIPFTLTVGKHDTATTCSESAHTCGNAAASRQLRDTSVFNRYFPSRDFTHLEGQFETGKLDNAYSMYQAGGLEWLVLTLENWPRPEAVQWADRVVAAHPHTNVIVATHMYLTASGDISRSDGGFESGTTSPQYVFDHLVKRHQNIKLVFSGHTGGSTHRVDKGVNGNIIYSFLQTLHDPKHDPTRLVQVDTAQQTLSTRVYVSDTDKVLPGTELAYDHIGWVR
jgi:hypothetical protein